MGESVCKSCGARITWCRTERGKMIPLNADPDPKGNVVIERGIAHVMGAGTLRFTEETRYMPHRATCPSWPRG